MCVVGAEVAFSGLERICSKAPQGLNSVMTVDPTFREFHFTPVTFKNLAVHRKLTRQSKIDMGHSLNHQWKVFFKLLLFSIQFSWNKSRGRSVDMLHTFHKKFEERQNTLPAHVRNIIIQDFFGKVEGTHKYKGLTHAPDTDFFNVVTESIKDKWKQVLWEKYSIIYGETYSNKH